MDDPHYELIGAFYGEKTAKRSGVRYMNHIDEGLVILEVLGASLNAKRAFCLHPIVQDDEDMRGALRSGSLMCESNVELAPLMLAVEYRVVANGYLSSRAVPSELGGILLSSLPDVNLMLVADKVQNRKDFEMHHEGKHPRSLALITYFKTWLARLDISEQRYHELAKSIVS